MSIYKKYTRDNAGFSFAELMVVIALVGVLAAIAVPNFLRGMPERRLKNAARNLYADMQKARMTAVKENRKVVVKFDTGASGDFYYFVDDVAKDSTQATFRRNLSEDGKGVSYGSGKATTKWDDTSIDSITTDITFNSTGSANSGSTYLQNENKNVCYAITTTDYGAVKIRRFNGTSWDKD